MTTPKQQGKNAASFDVWQWRYSPRLEIYGARLCDMPEDTPAEWDWFDGYISRIKKNKKRPFLIIFLHPSKRTRFLLDLKLVDYKDIRYDIQGIIHNWSAERTKQGFTGIRV